MKKFFLILSICFSISCLKANEIIRPDVKIKVNNTILAKVFETTISVIDVMKKMNMVFHRAYPEYANNLEAKYQFFMSSWKNSLSEMINTELIILEANDKDAKVSDGEIREEMENRFGPNIMINLEKLNVSYNEAWKLIKNDIIVKKMIWFNINSKVLQRVTPKMIKEEYVTFRAKNPDVEKWNYKILSIKAENENLEKEIANKIHLELKDCKTDELQDKIKNLQDSFKNAQINISNEYNSTSKSISIAHKSVLTNMANVKISKPVQQQNRVSKKNITRIYYLNDYSLEKTPTLDKQYDKIKNELLDKEAIRETKLYNKRLRSYYGYEKNAIEEALPKDFQPFSMQ